MRKSGWFKIPGLQDGKKTLERQMRGLDVVRDACQGAALLDLGCAEGLIALEMAKAGARIVHGVELEGNRLIVANAIFGKHAPRVEYAFTEWDLARFDDLFLCITADGTGDQHYLLTRYDVVLCLAIAQKLPNPARFLRLASALCSDIMAVRLPFPVIDDVRSFNVPVDVKRMLGPEFVLIQETEGFPQDLTRPFQAGDLAWLGIFRRKYAQSRSGPGRS